MSSTEHVQRPRLLVFAGPNGSGKSTVTQKIPLVGLYVNADDIKRVSGCSDLEAAQEAETIRVMLLAAHKDFTFETVLSTERNLELLRRAKEYGYQIFAVYVLTKDSAINVMRVQRRAAAGGHDVPAEKITSRYKRSLRNIAVLVRIADETRIVDNTGVAPDVICEVLGNSVSVYETEYWKKRDILALLAEQKSM